MPSLTYSIYLFGDDGGGDGKEIVAGFDVSFVCGFE